MASKGHEEIASLRPQLLAFARRRLRCPHLAEDAVQEAMVAALEGLERYAGDASLRTWLTGILKHKIVDSLRAGAREEPLDTPEAAHDRHPENEVAQRRLVERVDARLRQLPACAARVFVMREAMGMDTAEVCRELSISRSNCWVMSHRARLRLRALAADAL
jgi:RNA polymerase sigma-70 factor (ECF subfamily)